VQDLFLMQRQKIKPTHQPLQVSRQRQVHSLRVPQGLEEQQLTKEVTQQYSLLLLSRSQV